MKRTIALILSLIMLLCLPAYAAGNLEVTEDNWYVVSHSDDYRVYYFAAAKNGTDKTTGLKDAVDALGGDKDTAKSGTLIGGVNALADGVKQLAEPMAKLQQVVKKSAPDLKLLLKQLKQLLIVLSKLCIVKV